MRSLLGIITVLALTYSGFWFAAGAGLDSAIQIGTQEAQERGWQIKYDEKQISGFPSRLDTTLTHLDVRNAQVHLRMPLLKVMALAYKPHHVIAYAPGPHELKIGTARGTLDSEDLRASVRLRPNTDLPLAEARLNGQQLNMTTPFGALSIGTAQIALRHIADARYELFLQLDQVDPPVVDLAKIPAAPSERFDQASVRAQLVLSAPINRHMQSVALSSIDLEDANLRWGDSQASLRGEIRQDSLGPSGWIEITTQNPAPLLDALAQITTATGPLRQGIEAITGPDGRASITLRISQGQVMIGPVPLMRLSY